MRTAPARVARALFAVQAVALDAWMHGAHFYVEAPRASLLALASVAFWYAASTLCASRFARATVAYALSILLVVEVGCYRYYHVPLDAQGVASAVQGWADVRPVVVHSLGVALLAAAALAALEYRLLAVAVARSAPRRFPAALALATCSVLVVPGYRELLTPRRAAPRAALRVPELRSRLLRLPSILLVIDESVRASDYCSKPIARCNVAPEVNALLPRRIPLEQLRSVDSYTTLSISALFTGQPQTGPRAAILEHPDLFQLAHAVRAGRERLAVAYWSAQRKAVFESDDTLRAADSVIDVEALLGRRVDDEDTVVDLDLDGRLSGWTSRKLPTLAKPFLLVLHLAGTHEPYFVDPADAPFAPWVHESAWSSLDHLHNAYLDAIHDQDRALAAAMRSFIAAQGGDPWLIVFTSDHGEAFGEHHAIHHGQNLYDEQIHVPGFVAWGNGALDADQIAHLTTWSNRSTTHLDILPTLLDAFGVLDTLDFAPLRGALPGRSLLGPVTPMTRPIALTNCSEMFTCPLDAWGLLFEDHAIQAQPWDADWRCTDFRAGDAPLDDPACRSLVEASRGWFPRLPNQHLNR